MSHPIKVLAALHEAGINTLALVDPLLPQFTERPELLDHLFRKLAETVVREVYMEHIKIKRYIREQMNVVVEGEPEEARRLRKGAVCGAFQGAGRHRAVTAGQPRAGSAL